MFETQSYLLNSTLNAASNKASFVYLVVCFKWTEPSARLCESSNIGFDLLPVFGPNIILLTKYFIQLNTFRNANITEMQNISTCWE